MSWWQWLIGRLFKRPPGRVTNVHIKVSAMKTITVTWDVPTTREDGKSLPKAEIADTEVLLAPVAADNTVGQFVSLARVKPDATQTVVKDVPDGNYKLRFIVTDIYGNRGKPLDASATVKSAPPGQVLNIKVTVE